VIKIRPSDTRGHADLGWLDSYRTFAFDTYRSLRHRGYGSLRVINEDRVQPGCGFETHSHADVEILTYVLEGAVRQEDDGGRLTILRPGDVQLIGAGTGFTHSEYNLSSSEPARVLQIWIRPREKSLPPLCLRRSFDPEGKRGRLRLLAAPDGRGGALPVRQDAEVWDCALAGGQTIRHPPPSGRRVWVQALRGSFFLNGVSLRAGDGAALKAVPLRFSASAPAEFILFNLA
jgi:quercetin 2,3-dioxygenase